MLKWENSLKTRYRRRDIPKHNTFAIDLVNAVANANFFLQFSTPGPVAV